MKRCTIGIDTSNYTTSVGVVDEALSVIANIKIPLPVKEGARGLRQSDAVFEHVRDLPKAFELLKPHLASYTPVAIGVSARPRNQEGSYMPCFLSGVAAAEGIAAVADLPCYSFSHQCGHLMAALLGAGATHLMGAPFGAFHVSGGTTELVQAGFSGVGFSCRVVGGSADLHAGQVIDRIGVAMGLPFPSGAAMDTLALSYKGRLSRRRPSLDGTYCHLSGLENLALDRYRTSGDEGETAAFVFDYIGASLMGMTEAFRNAYGDLPILYAGGVMSSRYLKNYLAEVQDAHFAPADLSADNAVGIAALTAYRYFQ